MRQILVALGSIAFILLWIAAWGYMAGGLKLSGAKHLVKVWLQFVGVLVAVSLVIAMLIWPFIPFPS